MKQSLQLKLGQQLTMTPQLQQAIRLLQLSTMDLQQEIQQAIETNPMLELEEEDFDAEPAQEQDQESQPESEADPSLDEVTAATETETAAETTDDDLTAADDWNNEIPDDRKVRLIGAIGG